MQDIAKASLVGKLTDITGDEYMHSGVRARVGNEQGVTIATLVGEAYTEAYKKAKVESSDGNLIVTPIASMSDEENTAVIYNVETNPDSTYRSITINPNIRTTGDFTGINMNNTNITNLAPGEISANSTEAINGSQLWETNRNMDKLGGRLDKVGAGAAALAALHPMDFDPDDKLQFSAGVGNYGGETAAALGAFYRPTEKVMFSVVGTMGNGENMVNAGVTFALDRKNNVSNSRVAMAHEIQDLRDQVAALTALVSQIAGKGNPLLDTVMFPDVPENHWAYDYIDSLQKRGIIEGYPDGNFGGDRSCTRYEYAAMLYRALEKGFPVDGRLLKEFEAELGRIRIDRIKGADDDANKVERVRVNDYEDRDDYGSKLAQVVADAAPAIEEEPAA
ncbi:MAG: YadA-like family protein [Phascolarctobacterium sp.]|nr:YadA-like family protein [Phascolarctobacterium sp.]